MLGVKGVSTILSSCAFPSRPPKAQALVLPVPLELSPRLAAFPLASALL